MSFTCPDLYVDLVKHSVEMRDNLACLSDNFVFQIKRLLLRCIHHFKPDIVNNMDHMRISGTEPSSVILSQTK